MRREPSLNQTAGEQGITDDLDLNSTNRGLTNSTSLELKSSISKGVPTFWTFENICLVVLIGMILMLGLRTIWT